MNDIKQRIVEANKACVFVCMICLVFTTFAHNGDLKLARANLFERISEMKSAINSSTNINWLIVSERTLSGVAIEIRGKIRRGELDLARNDAMVARQKFLQKHISKLKEFIDAFEELSVPNKNKLLLKREYDKALLEYRMALGQTIDIQKIEKCSDITIKGILEYESQLRELKTLLKLIDRRKRELKKSVNNLEVNPETSPIGTSLLATGLASLFVLKMVNSHANNSITIGEA